MLTSNPAEGDNRINKTPAIECLNSHVLYVEKIKARDDRKLQMEKITV